MTLSNVHETDNFELDTNENYFNFNFNDNIEVIFR